MRVVSWLWSQAMHQSRHRAGRQAMVEAPVRIPEGTSLAEAMAMLSLAHGSRACQAAIVEHDDPLADRLALEKLARKMNTPRMADLRNLYNREDALAAGFQQYEGVGR